MTGTITWRGETHRVEANSGYEACEALLVEHGAPSWARSDSFTIHPNGDLTWWWNWPHPMDKVARR